ncbi:MAG: hypothetical protein SGI88_09790, partial [Candidatus Hydrogenedentes bacterium]|nr:hypothetical protein [Candidatus Hydrogenedentota bacterium]
MTRSIHGRVAAGVMAGLFVVLTLCGSALYLYVRHALTANFDDALAGKARAFAALSKQDEEEYEAIVIGLDQLPQSARETVLRALDSSSIEDLEQITHEGRLFYKVETIRRGVESEFLVSGDGVYLGVSDEFDFAFDKAALPEFQPSSKAEYYHVWDEDNDTVAKSPSLGEAALAIPHAVATSPRTYNITLPDGRSGRAIARQFIPRSDGPGENEPLTLVMAQSREGLDQSLRVVRTGLLMAAVLTALAIIAVVRLSVHVGLRALNTLASQAATIDADTLAYRFPADGMTAELAPICERLNEL